jgi:N-acetylmuramoyl-L-alanine amidase
MSTYRKISTIIVLMLLVAMACPPATLQAQPAKGKPVVMIDPGHGGAEAGVSLSDKFFEKDLVLSVALAVQKELNRSGRVDVRLTRSQDVQVAVADRIKMVQATHPDAFISLHVNAGFGKNASGYEVYFPGFSTAPSGKDESAAILTDMAKNKYLNDSVNLAQIIQRNLQGVFPRKGRGLREAGVPILEGLTIPAVVLEIAFATNLEDKAALMDAKSQRAIAEALSRSIKEYLNL